MDSQKEQKKAFKEIEVAFKDQIEQERKLLGKTHQKKEFTFTTDELRHMRYLASYAALSQKISELATSHVDDVINNQILSRVGIEPNNKMKVSYSVSLGRFIVWIPREEKVDKPVKN